jgi:hypothetical protein
MDFSKATIQAKLRKAALDLIKEERMRLAANVLEEELLPEFALGFGQKRHRSRRGSEERAQQIYGIKQELAVATRSGNQDLLKSAHKQLQLLGLSLADVGY